MPSVSLLPRSGEIHVALVLSFLFFIICPAARVPVDPTLHNWVATPGEFAILVGSSSAQINLRGKYSLGPGQENR
jgi:hypothetical protein